MKDTRASSNLARGIVQTAVIALCFLFRLSPAEAEAAYEFERMWPTLQQPWYFRETEHVVVDSEGDFFIVDGGNA